MPVLYSPLNPDEEEIRLLTILPSRTQNAPVQCRLHIASLKTSPQFEALSYVWGGDRDRKKIILDNQSFDILPNLEAVLRRLRHQRKARVVWADYICINQNDIPEKNKQIPLMAKIYSNATVVIAWLGQGTPETEFAISWLKARFVKYTFASLYWWMLSFFSRFSIRIAMRFEMAQMAALEGWIDVLLVPYWSRMWTLQEYRLAAKEPICMAGNQAFSLSMGGKFSDPSRPLHTLAQIHRELYPRWDRKMDELLARKNRRGYSTEKEIQTGKDIVNHATKHKQHHELYTIKSQLYVSGPAVGIEFLRSSSRKLYNLLALSATRKCTDPRDKVYALYSMCPTAWEAFPPDYSKSVDRVMLETTVFIIRNEISTAVLELFLPRDNDLEDMSLPSWVPDFSRLFENNDYLPSLNIFMKKLYFINKCYHVKVTEDLATLETWGLFLGNCDCHFTISLDTDHISSVEQFVDHVRERHLPNIGNEDVCDDLALCLDQTTLYGQSSVAQLREAVVEIFQAIAKTYGVRLRNDLRKTLFLVQSSGTAILGISPSEVHDGDILVMPANVDYPWVLRKIDSDDEDGVYYQRVGLAYLHPVTEQSNCNGLPFVEEVKKQPLLKYFIK